MEESPSFDKPFSRQVDCVAAWQKQEGRPIASPKKQAQERLVETLLRKTQKPTQRSQAGELYADNKKWDSNNGMRPFSLYKPRRRCSVASCTNKFA
jgi:hypothetical protein